MNNPTTIINACRYWMAGLVLILGCWGSLPVGAQEVPVIVNFQGKLYDPAANSGAGGPLTGVQQVSFRIYDNLTGGTLIWGRKFPVFCNVEGVFNVMLNDNGTSLGGTAASLKDAFQAATRFLEMQVDGHGSAISPRQQIVSAPYAFHSQHATTATSADQGFTVTGGLQIQSGGLSVNSGSLTATHGANISGGVTLNGGFTNNGGARLSGGVTVKDGFTASGGATLDGNVVFNSGTLTVNGGRLTANQGLTISQSMTANGSAEFKDVVVCYQDAQVNKQLFVEQQSYLAGISASGLAFMGGGLAVAGHSQVMSGPTTLTSGSSLSYDGLIAFINAGDLDVTIGTKQYKYSDAASVTLFGYQGDKVSWNNCDRAVFFFPFHR